MWDERLDIYGTPKVSNNFPNALSCSCKGRLLVLMRINYHVAGRQEDKCNWMIKYAIIFS